MIGCDVAWMLVATALVLLMTPALGFFYGGLVRGKNALNTLMMSVASLGFVGVAWALAGYSLAFAPGGAALGGASHLLLAAVGLEPRGSIPHLLFMAYHSNAQASRSFCAKVVRKPANPCCTKPTCIRDLPPSF